MTQNDPGFGKGGCSTSDARGPLQRTYQAVPLWLSKENGEDGAGVEDHTPSGPKPKMTASSSLLRWRPSWSAGMEGQISVSRNSIHRSRLLTTTPTAKLAMRCSSAFLTASVLLSPV